MYTVAINKINNAYQLVMLYELTFPDGTVREKMASKKTKSGTPLSKKELTVLAHVWVNDILFDLQKKYNGSKLRVTAVQIDCYFVNKYGNELVEKNVA